MYCPSIESYIRYHRELNGIDINPDTEKNTRFDVWSVTPKNIHEMINSNSSAEMPGIEASRYVKSKINNALSRVAKSKVDISDFLADIIGNDKDNIDTANADKSIALREVMEAIKGEADKARNNDIDMSLLEVEGILPALPLSRIAASIGRKSLYFDQIRFKSNDESVKDAAEIEQLYYTHGLIILRQLEDKGYVNFHEDHPTIRDYTDSEIADNKFSTAATVVTDVRSISLNTDKLGVSKFDSKKPTELTQEAAFFLNRTESDIKGTKLGKIVDVMTAVGHVTQASLTELPDTVEADPNRVLSDNDPKSNVNDPISDSARQKLYDNPLRVNKSVHGLIKLLSEAMEEAGQDSSASQIIAKAFKGSPIKFNSLFGIKASNDFSVDRKESIQGQNLSKTVPLDDVVDVYRALMDSEGNPVDLHMAMKGGRNQRLYYTNSVLNAHASKQSRHMLTSGEQTIEIGSDNFKRLVNTMAETLDDETITYSDIVDGGNVKLERALKAYKSYENSKDLSTKLVAISRLPVEFPGVDYAALLSVLAGVSDIRSAKGETHVTTEFMHSADATAQGGTLTIQQALGTNANIEALLQRLGIIRDKDGNVIIDTEQKLNDIYGLMSEGITNFISGDNTRTMAIETKSGRIEDNLQQTLNLLFGGDAKGTRNLSKDATMPFIYGQGEVGATSSMSDSIAQRVIDNLDRPDTISYLADLLDDNSIKTAGHEKLKDTRGLYPAIKKALNTKGVPLQLYRIMESEINNQYLKEFKADSKAVFELANSVKNPHNLKVLPAGAVLAGIEVSEVQKYGMPLTKVVEVSSAVTGNANDPLMSEGGHTVLTRKQQLFKSIMDVSVIHGIDSGLMYHALDKVIGTVEGNNGAIVVHDQVIGSVELVRRVEEEYVKLNSRMVAEYDTHQQVMLSIAQHDPAVARTPKFKALMAKLDARLAAKAKFIAEERFNEDTDALIGDGDSFKTFSEGYVHARPTTKSKPKAKTTVKTKEKVSTSDIGTDMTILLEGLRSKSTLIDRFLDKSSKPAILGAVNSFDTENDQVVIQADNISVELIEHEIVHHNTAGYIAKALHQRSKGEATELSTDVEYFRKATFVLRKYLTDVSEESAVNKMGQKAYDRAVYMVNSDHDPATQIAEFVAIMSTESKVSEEIYKVIAGRVPTKTLKARISDFVKKVTKLLTTLSAEDFTATIDADKLQDALVRTLENGRSFKEDKAEEAMSYQIAFKTLNAGPGISESMRYMNDSVSSMLESQFERRGKSIAGNIHKIMSLRFPMYVDAANKLKSSYEGSEAMQQLIHTITGEGTNKTSKADLLAQSAKVESDHRSSIAHQHQEFKKALKGVDDSTKETIGRFVTQLPLHDYFVLAKDFNTAAKIDAEVARLESVMSKQIMSDIDGIIDRNVNRKTEGDSSIYSLSVKYRQGSEDKHGNDIKRLLALKSIQTIGSSDFESFLGNTDLVNLIKDNVMANKLNLIKIGGASKMRDSLLPDYWKESPQMLPVTIEEARRYAIGEETGWKVLREPTKSSLGIVYKEMVDSTELQGSHTDIGLKSTDIDINTKAHKSYNGILETADGGYKLVLTDKERATAGIEDDFVDTLIRGTAHSIAVNDSQYIRDAIIKSENRFDGTDAAKLDKLNQILKSKNADAPWFVKLDKDQTYSNLKHSIRAKYKVIDDRASDVIGESGNKFSDEVHLVRKDMSHFLVGGHSSSPFQNKKMKWAVRIVKDIMAGTKIGMVVLNPVKIAMDNVSNLSYLSVSGASPLFIAKQYRDISRSYNDYQNLVHQMVTYKVRLAADENNENIKAKIAKLQKSIDANPVGDLAHKGFVNSLGSDLVARSSDVSSGLQVDMETALTYLLKDKKGDMNVVGQFINNLHKIGFQSEDFVKYLGGIVGRAKDGKAAHQQLDLTVERIKSIKTEDDIVSYVSQYTTSPGSELVRLGSSMTDLTDVLAKETLYRHAMQNEGMSAEAARVHVLDSFPDYKENLPMAVKQLSDVGIIMFPSFWLRIQKAIYRMARDKPVGLSTELAVEHYLTGSVNTVFDANIINKSESFGGVFHMPLESSGLGSAIPLNIL